MSREWASRRRQFTRVTGEQPSGLGHSVGFNFPDGCLNFAESPGKAVVVVRDTPWRQCVCLCVCERERVLAHVDQVDRRTGITSGGEELINYVERVEYALCRRKLVVFF